MIKRLVRWCDHPRFPWVLAAIAFVLALPSLQSGAFLDDRFHEYILQGHKLPSGPRGIWDLYRFADGGPGLAAERELGTFPWWTNTDLTISFFRPIASLWLAFDHAVWGNNAWGQHLETCVLYVALAVVVWRAFRGVIGGPLLPGAAGLAALFFAVEDGHATAITWTANRYALLAALLSFLALGMFVKAREAKKSGVLSALVLALALASGEASLGVVGFLFAYALFQDPSGRKSAFVALIPHVLVVVAWAVCYRMLGCGARGSSLYIDPATTPVRFLLQAVQRGPILVLAQMFGPPAEVAGQLPAQMRMGLALAGVLFGGAIVWGVARLAKDHPATRTLLVGALLALGPSCAMAPDDRLLMIPGFGAFGAIAIALTTVWSRPKPKQTLGGRVFAGTLLFVHVIVAGLLLPAKISFFPRVFRDLVALGAKTLPLDESIRDKNIVVLGAPDALIGNYMLMERLFEGAPTPKHLSFASVQSEGPYEAVHVEENVVEITNPKGMNTSQFCAVFRDHAYVTGEHDRGSGFDIEIVEVLPTGVPSKIRLTFDEGQSIRWLVWTDAGFTDVPSFEVGEKVTYEGVDMMAAAQKAGVAMKAR